MSKENLSAQVGRFATENGRVTRKQIRDALGLTDDQVRSALETLTARGRLVRAARGLYECKSEPESAREAPLEDRIWHAMRICPSFSVSEIARLAGSTTSYIYKRMRLYRAEALVASHGRREIPGGSEKLWRLTMKGHTHIHRPPVEEYRPDPLKVAAVKLNRLVCTGLVRFVDERREALRLARNIAARLATPDDLSSRTMPEDRSLQATSDDSSMRSTSEDCSMQAT